MIRRKLNKAMLALLLTGVVAVATGCHKNQNAQTAENSPSAAQPAANPSTSAPAAPAPAGGETAAPASTTPAPASTPAPAAAPEPAPARAPASRRSAAHAATEQASAAPGSAPAAGAEQATSASAPLPPVIPDGTALQIRINQNISTKTSQDGDKFDGTIVQPVTVNGTVVIPDGSTAYGQVVDAQRGGRFKGRPELQLTLVALDVNGRHYNLDTTTLVRTQKGKGKRTAAFIGGGAGGGALIGGVASGGVGLVVGGLTGAAAGTVGAAFTGHRDIDLPAESVMNFRLEQPIQLQ